MPLLADVLRPGIFRVMRVCGEGSEVTRLKRLGVCENRTLEVVNTGNPLVICVAGTRLGISRSITRCIEVQTQSPADAPSAEEH